MEPEWLSYQEVADRLGITPETARSRAKRPERLDALAAERAQPWWKRLVG